MNNHQSPYFMNVPPNMTIKFTYVHMEWSLALIQKYNIHFHYAIFPTQYSHFLMRSQAL
jgi:hypothetical protein